MEIWKYIPDTNDLYQISSAGRVGSLNRIVEVPNRKGKYYIHKGKILKPNVVEGFPRFTLRINKKSVGITVRIAVLKIFGTYDKALKILHIDGDRLNCSIDNLEQHDEAVECTLNLPHVCNRGCGTVAKTVDQVNELFPSHVISEKRYYRSNCKDCRNNEEKIRFRERTKKKRLEKARIDPARYEMCYDCGNVQLNTKKACTECNSAELSQFEEI